MEPEKRILVIVQYDKERTDDYKAVPAADEYVRKFTKKEATRSVGTRWECQGKVDTVMLDSIHNFETSYDVTLKGRLMSLEIMGESILQWCKYNDLK